MASAYPHEPKAITVHTTATTPSMVVTTGWIEKLHKKRFGTKYKCPITNSCAGYHYLIKTDGSIHQMRDHKSIGIHTRGFNSGNIGIALEGGLDANHKAAFTYSSSQMMALETLIKDLRNMHNIDVENIKGHRDHSPDLNGDGVITSNEFTKECPCFDVQEWLYEVVYPFLVRGE